VTPISRLRRLFTSAADPTRDGSLSNRLRTRRFAVVERLIREEMRAADRPVRILDVGGTAEYWMKRSLHDASEALADDPRVEITLLNIEYHDYDGAHPRLERLVGDARSLQFADDEFDLVLSNSTMEHVGDRAEQARMAREVQRVGKRCYVQVPCRWFPIEPHTGFPFFGVLPFKVKVWLIRHVDIGHAGREDDAAAAEGRARDAHLLTARQTVALFSRPLEVHRERVAGLTKSVAVVS
jgi:SAM-dependent methyltransferase